MDSSWNEKIIIMVKKKLGQNLKCTSRRGLDLKSELNSTKNELLYSKSVDFFQAGHVWNPNNHISETKSLGDQKSLGEIYGTVFKKHILKRKTYLKWIWN